MQTIRDVNLLFFRTVHVSIPVRTTFYIKNAVVNPVANCCIYGVRYTFQKYSFIVVKFFRSCNYWKICEYPLCTLFSIKICVCSWSSSL